MLNGKKCERCDKHLVNRQKRFCSRKCVCLHNCELQKGKPAHNRNKVEAVCKYCGKVRKVPVSLSDRPFCNRGCMSKWMSENIGGENHWHWQGGITEVKSRDNLYPGYKEWRTSVYRRDNYTCQTCGENKSGSLQAHHIKDRANHPDLIVDIDNGITLCKKCHMEVHYGNKLQRV